MSSTSSAKGSCNNSVDSEPVHEVTETGNPTTLQPPNKTESDITTSTSCSIGGNPFSDPEVAERYRQIYEQTRYECRPRFDPYLTWTPEEERRLVRRTDFRVCLWACVMFMGLQVDGGSISQALSETLLQDLKMNTNDFNLANTLFSAGFIVGEFPSQLFSKAFGPDRWTPILMTTWSFIAMSQAAITTKTCFFIIRAVLGLLVGGFIPDAILWLSYFYTSKELPIRISYFFSTVVFEKIIITFTGIGILHLRGVAGWPGWRWLFIIQGLLPLTVSIASYFMMPPSIVQTKTWFRPNGWYSDREEAIAVNRLLRDDPAKGDMNNRQAVTPGRIWNALKDFDLWPIYVIGFFINVPQGPPNTYLVITLRNLGFNTYITNLLIIPSALGYILALVSITWLSGRYKECASFAMIQSLWTLPSLIALRFWPGTVKDVWGTYALITVLLSYPSSHAIMIGWLSKNCNGVGSRAMSVTIQNMIYLSSTLFANNIYVESDKPLYHKGNTVLIVLNVTTLVLLAFAKIYYILRNKHRDRLWANMTAEERSAYIYHSKDVGTRRLDFRFVH